MFNHPPRFEPGPGQESVWDYPRPPRVELSAKRVKVIFNGLTVAETRRAQRVLETAGAPVYYIPPEDVKIEYLSPSGKKTFCEWKGWASYFDIEVEGKSGERVAWAYSLPNPGYKEIKDYLASYAQKMDACFVDEEKVRP